MSTQSSISMESLREMLGEDASEFLKDIAPMFVADFQEHVEKIRNAFEAGDFDYLWRTAHSVKGSSANVGAVSLSKLCGDLETNGRNANAEQVKEIIPLIEKEFERVRVELDQLV